MLCCPCPALTVSALCNLEAWKSPKRLRASCQLELIRMPLSQAEIRYFWLSPYLTGLLSTEQWDQWAPWGISSLLSRAIFSYTSVSDTINVHIKLRLILMLKCRKQLGEFSLEQKMPNFQRSGSSANKCWLQSFGEPLPWIPTGSLHCSETTQASNRVFVNRRIHVGLVEVLNNV